MAVSEETINRLHKALRDFIPVEFGYGEFAVSEEFETDFEVARIHLIAALADAMETSLLNVGEGITEEFLLGWMDGQLGAIKAIAKLNLNREGQR